MVRLAVLMSMLLFVPSAGADRVSETPLPFHTDSLTSVQADVGADGTSVVGQSVRTHLAGSDTYTFSAAVGDHPPVEFAGQGTGPGAVAALPGGRAWAAFSYSDSATNQTVTAVRRAEPDGSFGPPQVVGQGMVTALVTNRAGDAALVLGGYPYRGPFSEAFAPAGGTFGDPVPLGLAGQTTLAGTPSAPGFAGLTLSDTGDATALAGWNQDVQAVSRFRDSPPGSVATWSTGPRGTAPAVAADAHGHVLVAWAKDLAVRTVLRAGDGTWAALALTKLPAAAAVLRAATNPAGDAIVAWRDTGRDVRALNLTDGKPQRPVVIDRGAGSDIRLAEAADGSAIVATGDANTDPLHLVRRTGTRPFGDPAIIGCPAAVRGAWLPDTGAATVLAGDAFVHVTSGPGSPPPCAPTAPPTITTDRHGQGLRVHVADAIAEPLRLVWRAHGRVLATRLISAPATLTLRGPRGYGRGRTTLVLRRHGRLVAIARTKASAITA